MIFLALKTEDGRITGKISFYCRMLGISRQGFYKYLANKDRPWKYQDLADAMKEIISEDECNDTYGRIRMYQALQKLRDDGYTLVVGGVTGTRMARALGMNSLLIPSGREAVCDVLDRAVFLHEQLRRSRLDVRLLKNLIDSERCFSIVFDEARHVVFQSTNVYACLLYTSLG